MNDLAYLEFRPSMAPGFFQCPSYCYRVPGEPRQASTPNVFSATGTALHRVFYEFIYPGIAMTEEKLKPIASELNVSMDGYYGIKWRAFQVLERWERLRAYYTSPFREQLIKATLKNGLAVEGTPDMYQLCGEHALVFDLKTGEQDVDYFPQLQIYALILYLMYGHTGLREFYCTVYSPMLEKYETRVYSAAFLEDLHDQLVARMDKAGHEYALGVHCKYCKRLTRCPEALNAIDPLCEKMRMVEIKKSGTGEIVPADIARMRPAVLVMEKVIERYKLIEKTLLDRFGVIDLGNGTELFYRVTPEAEFDPFKAYEVLRKLGQQLEGILAAMKINKTAVVELAKADAADRKARGEGGTQKAKVQEYLDAMYAAGACEDKPAKKVATRPLPITQGGQQ